MDTTPTDADRAPGLKRLTPTQVAVRLGIRYLKARDLMTRGLLGRVQMDGSKMTVPLAGVLQYEQRLREEAARNAPKQ